MLPIGEFSKVTQLTIKALRIYHEEGILIPDKIDKFTNYRYYGDKAFERAKIIKDLKEFGFSLNEIKSILEICKDDREVAVFLEKKLKEIESKIKEHKFLKEKLKLYIENSKEDIKMDENFSVVEKSLPEKFICGIRFTGIYQEVGNYFKEIYKKAGRYSTGTAFALYYDAEYKENDADIETCTEVKKEVKIEGLNCRKLQGGKCVSIMHKGPYANLHKSYKKIFDYCTEKKYKILIPIREFYIKGPGMIFKGNPNYYISEIVFMV
ncbi:MerR family transcriptional regulator [Candidatus Desantisbacteria bacterium]|nr:MerR family transcriptional regulator [Candidatus Desantisbacteria bacterium]